MARSGVDKAFQLIRNLPRVSLSNLKPLPGTHKKHLKPRGQHTGNKTGRGNKGAGGRNTLPRLGFEGGNTPFYLIIPKEPYYRGHHVRKQYPPVSLLQLQRLIDLGRIDPAQPVDLTALCNTHILSINVKDNHYGVNLTDEGVDIFQAKLNIEVQWTNEQTIAAIEKNGGVITTKYYDPQSVFAMSDSYRFFRKGVPIPHCKLPPESELEYYSDPENRGYLADPDKIQESRVELAQKYGYTLPDLSKDPMAETLRMRKDPRQIWYGLEPGWVVNLRDKTILKPTDEELLEYYKS